MPPKNKAKEEPPPVVEEDPDQEPAEVEIRKLCFRTGSQLYYGDCKLGYKARKGTYVRHGCGLMVDAVAVPARYKSGEGNMYETVILNTYEGPWDEDVMAGSGQRKRCDGSTYEGTLADGQPHGHGRFTWPDGSVYDGAWHQGAMHGQGRFDSRFDGSFLQGRFYRNHFQNKDGRWMDILEKHREMEQESVLDGDAYSLMVRYCGCSELLAGNPQQEAFARQCTRLQNALTEAQHEGFVPMLVADDTFQGSVLDCLVAACHSNAASDSVSVRQAAIAKRRTRDFHRYFFDAAGVSLRSGTHFVIVFEDDDSACMSVQGEEEEDWLTRKSQQGEPFKELPEEWQLEEFFDPDSFPLDVFRPRVFNGRGGWKIFLPEEFQRQEEEAAAALQKQLEQQQELLKQQQQLKPPPTPSQARATPAGKEGRSKRATPEPMLAPDPEEEAAKAVAAEAARASRELAASAAAAAGSGGTGPTGHFFTAEPEALNRAGLQRGYWLRPVVAALAQLPSGLTEVQLRDLAVRRFHHHVPLHSMVLLVITGGDEEPKEGAAPK